MYDKHAVLCFRLLKLKIRHSVFTNFKLNQMNLPLVYIHFLVLSKLLKIYVAGGYSRRTYR